jgi:hypothetical protein
MRQQGQVFALKTTGPEGRPQWAYRYRVAGRASKRVQHGDFETEQAAAQALELALERLRREQGLVETPTLSELVDVYLAQHEAEPETIEKLRWLLSKPVRAFGELPITELRSPEIAAWRMTIPCGHRFEGAPAAPGPCGQLGNAQHQPRQTRSRQPTTTPHRATAVRILGRPPRTRLADRAALRATRHIRRGDRTATKRMGRARAPRHRPRLSSALRLPSVPQRPAQMPENRSQRPRRTTASDRARRARPATTQPRVPARVPRAPRRLPRSAQLPTPRSSPAGVEASADRHPSLVLLVHRGSQVSDRACYRSPRRSSRRALVSAHRGSDPRNGLRPVLEVCGCPDRSAASGAASPPFVTTPYSWLIVVDDGPADGVLRLAGGDLRVPDRSRCGSCFHVGPVLRFQACSARRPIPPRGGAAVRSAIEKARKSVPSAGAAVI